MSEKRRKFLKRTAGLLGIFGLGAVSYPLVRSLRPTDRTIPPREIIEFPKLGPGEIIAHTTNWYQVFFVLKRSEEILRSLEDNTGFLADPQSEDSMQPDFAKNYYRSAKPEYLVVESECTHLGCGVAYRPAPSGAARNWNEPFCCFFCPCHGSKYDAAGRVWKGYPAPRNLAVPEYEFVSETSIRVFPSMRT